MELPASNGRAPDTALPNSPEPRSASTTTGDVTRLLRRYRKGDKESEDALFSRVHHELRRLARRHLSVESSGHSWQPTELVHEAYLRLVGQRSDWQNRAHFFSVAARVMRRLLIDHAKRRKRLKRPTHLQSVPLDSLATVSDDQCDELIAIDQALRALSKESQRAARVVELRFFGGLTEGETADVLGVTTRTVERDWKTARLWLYRHLQAGRQTGS